MAYVLLALTGFLMWRMRNYLPISGFLVSRSQLITLHLIMGISMVSLVLLLLAIGIIGTLGHFGSLGHSQHLWAGLIVVVVVFLSAFSATQISAGKPWARFLHVTLNIILFAGFAWVSLSGWSVVQKYLP
jgi:hypothetical protein